MNTRLEPLAYTMKEAASVSPFKKTRLYELIKDGRLESRVVGGHRFIPASSLRALCEGEAA